MGKLLERCVPEGARLLRGDAEAIGNVGGEDAVVLGSVSWALLSLSKCVQGVVDVHIRRLLVHCMSNKLYWV